MLYRDIHTPLDKFIQSNSAVEYMHFAGFYELKESGSGGYGTVYTAKYRNHSWSVPQTVALKRFKHFDQTLELFISEVHNLW